MAIKPTIEKEIDRGTGKIGSELDYLKVDPTTYFYNKFKSGAMSKFVRDDMWTEASIRGETNALINILSGIEKAAQTQTIDTSLLDKYEWYENQGYGDYDTYMFALGLPTYDDTKKVERINEITGESFGSYTDKEYAEMILNSTFQRYDAEMVEAEKEKRNKLVQFGIDLGVGIASIFTNIVSGVGNWLNDMYNIGEGLINLIANWSNDDSAGARFLWAFANDQEDPSLFKQLSDFNQEISYKLAYEYSTAVNAVEAYEQGYIPNEWGEYLGTGWRTEGNKVYRGFGAMWNGVTTSIGYMLPSIITAQVAGLAGAPAAVVKGLGSGAMYTGIASSNITETIEASGLNYKNLNAGNVISNAIIKAGVQYGIELALGKVLGFFSVSERLRGLGTTSVKNAVKIGSTEAKAFGIMLGRGIKGAAKEGLEETLQDLSDGIVDTVYSSFSGQLNEVYKANGAETISFNNLLQSFIAGALTEGIVGTIHTAFWSPGVDEKGNKIEFVGEREGKTFKLGKFQSMNFAQALAAMNEWNDTLNNANATKEEKANAAMKMSATINSVGDILGKFGTLDAIKANNLLLAQADNRAKREAIAKLSNTEYAKSLYDSFLKTYSSIKADYETQKEKKGDGLLNKIKAAIKNLLPKFKENNIDKLDGDIVTTTIESDNPNIGISQDAYAKLKGVLVNDLGAEALIGINGDMVAKSEGIIFVPNQWLIDGDVPKIIQALGYEDVRQAVKTALGASQRKRILNTYAKVVGKEATIDQAIDALLFDKIFYTKILLMTEEKTKTSKQEAIELLATIDNLIKSKGAEAVQKGTLERAAYNTLLNKVYQTMRTGLIVYATHYARLDLGAISNAVLPADIKTEISNHRNVIFSNQLDTVLNGKVLNDQDLTLFDNNVDKFNTLFDAETISLIKKKARSTNRLDRAEAAMMVIIASKVNQYKFNNDKVVYLPTSSDGIVESEHISNMEKFFGISFAELIAGDYDANDLAESAKQFICPGYQNIKETDIKENSRYDLSDKAARISCAKDVLFMLSGKTLTVGHDGTLLRIITKEDFLKDEYLGDAGNTKFKRDVIDGKITKVKDIAKSGISSKVLDVPISYDPVLTNSHFDETNNEIVLSATSDTFNVMHEITHATQLATKTGVNSELGGRLKTFENLPTSVLNSLDKYISTTFPMVYAFLSSGKLTNNGNKPIGTPDMIYYLLEGELQANATLTTHLFDIGFKWRDDKRTLVAPTKDSNGKEITWSMKANIKAVRAEFKEYVEQRKTEVQEKLIAKKNERKAKTPEGQMSLFDGLDGSDDFNLLTDDAKVDFLNKSEDVPLTSNEAKYGLNIVKNLNIRHLTPKESFALMGVKEADFNRIAKNQSDSSLYHLAGDSIVVNPLMRIFDKMYKDGILTKPVRLIEFFAGYGSQNFALNYLGKDYESWKIAEWAIKSIQAYKDAHHYTDNTDYAKDMSKQELIDYLVDIGVSMNYNEPVSRVSLAAKSLEDLKTIYNNIQATHNLVNIQRVTGESLDIKDTNNYDYLLTYSFPCQDLSRAGLRAGMKSGKDDTVQMTLFDNVEDALKTENRTRSSMLWEVDRILKELYEAGKPLPKVLLMENVTEVHNEQNNADFTKWQANLKKYGYTNSFADLAANDYGIPQKRVRTFMVSVLNGKSFTFPAKEPLTITVQDLMDKNVDNKYYLSTDAKYKAFMGHNANYANNTTKNPLNSRIAATLTTSQYKRAEGGNFYSDKVKGEVDLFSILHPKTTEQIEYSKKVLSKLEAGKKLTRDEVNKQSSMFSEDRVLTTLEEAALMQNPDIKEFTKNAYLKRDGDPIIFYRGSRKGHELTSPSKGLFMSTKEYIGTDYADSKISENKIPSLKAYVTNFTKDEVLEIDNKGGVWNRVILDDNLKALTQITTRASISTDTLVDQIFRLHPEIKAIWLRNVVEDPEERGKTGDDLIVNKQYTDGLKSVGIPDQNTFVYAWNRYYDLYKDELGDYSVDKVKEDLYTKFSKLFKQAIDTNDFTRLERAIKVEKGAFDYMKKDISEDKPIKYTKLESEESEKAKRYKKAWNDLYKYDHVYIKVRDPETTKSNLKYFAGQYLNSSVKNFVIGTTKDFDRLSDAIKTEIKKGSLTVSFLKNYIATTNNIKDFTFKAIAKYIYKNDEVAKLNYKQMSDLLDNLNIIVAAARVKDGLDPNAKMTPEEMIAKAKEVAERAKTDAAFAEQYKRAVNFADLLGVIDANGRNKFTSIIPDPAQLNSVFFNHYDGTAESIVDINALGKDIAINQEGEVRPNETYGYKARKRSATTEEDEVYDIKDATLNKALNEIDRQDKITVIREYWYDAAGKEMEAIQKKGMANLTEEDLDKIRNMARNLEMKTQMLTQATDEELNAEYLIAMENETLKKPNITPQITEELEFVRPKLQASPLSKVGSELTRLGNSISGKLNLKRYRSLPEDIQQYFIKDKSKYKFITSKYFNMSLDDRIKLRDTLQQINDSLRTTIAEEKRKVEASDIMARKFKKAQEREARAKQRLKDTEQRLKDAEQRIRDLEERKLSMRDTLNSTTRYRTRIPNQEFSFTNNTAPNKVVNELLKTTWTKSKMSKVQGVVSNREEIVANAKEFFAQNAATLLSAGVADIEQAVDWFINARMDNATDIDFKVFAAIKGYFLSWVLGQTRPGGLYANINTNLKQKIDLSIKELGTISGTLLSILNNMKAEINPFMAMASENIELDGVSIEGELKDKLFKAMESADVEKVQKAIDDIMLYVAENRSTRKSIYRKAVTLRSMSMLSGPLTWLRNKVSNMILKPLHKFTNKIGNMVFKGKTVAGQLKLDKQVTKPIQDYIKQHFIDNKFFDTFITNISKYNPSDIKEHLKTKTGKPTKEAIYANLILKSMYNQYYNDNMFNKDTKTGKFMNELYHKLMRVMSDDKYIREAAIRYFGKILAEHNTDISSGQITDAVMNDLSTALGLAMQDYMHSNNLFNDIEKAISKLGDGWWFMYKTILPFASSSWNWVKGAMKMTPMGLVRAIWNITHLEAKVAKVEKAWSEGRSQISPELTEYMARRDLGAGIIGTVAFIFGAILAGLGYMTLEEDDYGTPKLRLGNLVVDVSSIFGTSSILAGAALATGIKEKGWGKDGWLDGINKMVDFWIDDFPIMEIVEMDMYANGGFSMGWKQLESIALSYIPNFLSYFAGATYSGKLKKDTLWKRAVAKLPFFNLLLEREIDPYTGEYAEDDYFKNLINRMVPYFSIDIASQNERKTKQLGLTKKQLNGTYNINGQDFNVTGKDLQDINKAYGLWNAEDLTKFYNNQMKVKVQVDNNKYKTLSYSQMNDKQRKAAVQTIMSNNAEMAKIMAWTKAGNKYYGSANTYVTLRKRGITTNVYKGTKGFVKSK